MGNRKFILIAIVVLILVAVGTVVFLVSSLSQPDLPPPAPTPAPAPAPAPVPVQPPTQAPAPTPTPPAEPPPPATPPTVDTGGDIDSGVITNICGITGGGDVNGIGEDAVGTCGRCENLDGTDALCEPQAGESVTVTVCDDQTGLNCTVEDGGTVVDEDVTGLVYTSDYLDDGCTIQLSVFEQGGTTPGAATSDAATDPIDFVVFQKDDCDGSGDDGGDIPPADATVQCGDACIEDSDCATGDVCSANGICIIEECSGDPALCQEGDLCTLIDDSTGDDPGDDPGDDGVDMCGMECTENSECGTGNSCVDEVCVADVCTGDNADAAGCVDGCVPIDDSDETAQCGDPCSTNSDCPNEHYCSADGTCAAVFCKDGACEDGCQLPNTDLINDEVDRILFGVIILLIGAIIVRTNAHVDLFYAMGGRNITALFSDTERETLEREMARYEQQRKRKLINKAKSDRESFEENISKKIDK
jgi:hypothetical protein